MDNTAKLRPFYIAKILHEKTDEEAGFRLTKDSPQKSISTPRTREAMPLRVFCFYYLPFPFNTKTLDKNGICTYNRSIKILSDIKGYCNSK